MYEFGSKKLLSIHMIHIHLQRTTTKHHRKPTPLNLRTARWTKLWSDRFRWIWELSFRPCSFFSISAFLLDKQGCSLSMSNKVLNDKLRSAHSRLYQSRVCKQIFTSILQFVFSIYKRWYMFSHHLSCTYFCAGLASEIQQKIVRMFGKLDWKFLSFLW